MRQGNLLLVGFIIIGVLILGISGLFIYRNYHLSSPVYNTQPKEVPKKEKTASTSEESPQNISTSTSMGAEESSQNISTSTSMGAEESSQNISTSTGKGVLVAKDFKVSFEYPKEWGNLGIRLDEFDKIKQQLNPQSGIEVYSEAMTGSNSYKEILDSPFNYYEMRTDANLAPVGEAYWGQLSNLPADKWIGNPQFEELKQCCLIRSIAFFVKAQEKYLKRGKTMSYQQIFEASSTPEFIEITKEIIKEIPNNGLWLNIKKTISGATVSLTQYPEEFKDTTSTPGPWWENYFDSKENKQKVFEPLLKIYNQRTIKGIIKESTSTNELVGYWWGNMASFQHRISPEYIENLNGDFRGVVYFANEAQDAAFVPSYEAILINPAERVVIVFLFALRDLPEIREVNKKRAEISREEYQNVNSDESKSMGYSSLNEICYSYLRDPKNYENTELGNLLETIHQIIQSIKLTPSN